MPRADGKTDRAVDMARSGVSPREIAEVLGLTTPAVSQRLSEARRGGIRVPSFSGRGNGYTRIIIDMPDARLKAMLVAAAVERGLRPCDLARAVLEAVLSDKLVDAVLDDREVGA